MLPVSILISSLLVILLPNPIYALIALILVFLNTAIFLLSIKVQFLALIYLIVYIGAIAILFLFVIMLFNLRSLQKSDLKIKDFSFLTISFKFYFFFGLKFFGILALDIWNLVEYSTYFNKEAVYNQFDLQYFLTYVHWDILLFSNLFYTYYSYIFLLSGLVLLAAMIGSIVLALSTTENFQLNFLGSNEKPNRDQEIKSTVIIHKPKDFSARTLGEMSHNGLNLSRFFKKINLKLTWEQILWILQKNGWKPHFLHFPVLVFVRDHVDDFSNVGRAPLSIAEAAKASNPSLIPVETARNTRMPDDSLLAKYGYRIDFSDWAYDHKTNQIVKFWFESSLTNPKERGLYHEWIRMSAPWNLVTSAQVKKKAGFTGKDRATWFDPFWV
jgi:NADH:ubiquinone oxidoreductase subunit 6 (subunit J)